MGILDGFYKKKSVTNVAKFAKYNNASDTSKSDDNNNNPNQTDYNNVNKRNRTLEEDIILASDWIVKALDSSGYKADYTLESMIEIDRFFNEQSSPSGIIATNRGPIIFGLAAYVGQTAIKLYGGQWITDDNDPQGEVTMSIKLADGSLIWPAIKCMKRYQNGEEDSLYVYLYVLKE